MLIVTGTLLARPDTIDELTRMALEHVHRSRSEPGCLSHAVHRDVENPLLLVFLERWQDRAALDAHFAVPASGGFVKAAGKLVAARPTLEIYEVAG